MDLSKVKEQFDKDGYAIVEGFLSDEEVQGLRTEMADIISRLDVSEHRSVFRTSDDRVSDDYFMNSGDKIRFFFEPGAIDETGQLTVDKTRSVNKIGHALHCLNPVFKKVTFSDKVKKVVQAIGLDDPVVCQSMYIFKQPRIGGKVMPHQDSSFLYTSPQRLVGLWLALEDATVENGCLWFVPGSHKEGLCGNHRMVRKASPPQPGESSTEFVGTEVQHDQSRYIAGPVKKEGLCGNHRMVRKASPPQPGESSTEFVGTEVQHDQSRYIAGPVKKGTLVVIHGEVVHKSEPNHSERSREIYTFHVYDHAKAVYDDRNWLQPTEAQTFSHLFSES